MVPCPSTRRSAKWLALRSKVRVCARIWSISIVEIHRRVRALSGNGLGPEPRRARLSDEARHQLQGLTSKKDQGEGDRPAARENPRCRRNGQQVESERLILEQLRQERNSSNELRSTTSAVRLWSSSASGHPAAGREGSSCCTCHRHKKPDQETRSTRLESCVARSA